MSIEFSPQQIFEWRLQRDIDAMILRDQMAYDHRRWLLADSQRQRRADVTQKKKRDRRGSKKGKKRGPYKRRIPVTTQLSTSKYYAASTAPCYVGGP